MSVLIVACTPELRIPLRDRLRAHGVGVTTAVSVLAMRSELHGRHFSVAVIEPRLLDGSGLDAMEELRRSAPAVHVIITADPTDVDLRTESLVRGADDFVVAPFDLPQLTTRILAVRRPVDPARDTVLELGRFTLDLASRQVFRGARPLALAAEPFDLLAYLAARPGHPFTVAELRAALWPEMDDRHAERSVPAHVRTIRGHLEDDPRRPQILRTVRGTGYRLDLPPDVRARRDRTVEMDDVALRGVATLTHVEGRIVQADAAAATLFGLDDPSTLVGRLLVDLAPPASRDSVRRQFSGPMAAGASRTVLVDFDRGDGTEISVEIDARSVRWRGGAAGRLRLTQAPDLSARLRRLVTGILGDVTDAVIITDLHFHLRSWNAAAERLYGWREDEVLGRHVLDVLQWAGDGGALEQIWDGLEHEGRWRGINRHVTRDGSPVSVLATTTLMREDSGGPLVIVSVNRQARAGARATPDLGHLDEESIRHGLAADQFEVHYQPVITLDHTAVVCVEALVRWNHPDHGLLAPDAFIETAEESGLIRELGEMVLIKACRQAAAWHQEGRPLELAVNLSARQLNDPSLFDRISAVLAATGMDASRLWLEVTETSLVEEVDSASAVLRRLAELGVGIAIDDFGTGWASLTYLRHFPIHALKIDRSFVAGAGRNAVDTAIVRSIIALGSELGLFVIAEGIETKAQHRAVQRLGCVLGQGYHFARPAPASDLLLPPTATATDPARAASPDGYSSTHHRSRSRLPTVVSGPELAPAAREDAERRRAPQGPDPSG